MSELSIDLHWQWTGPDFEAGSYSHAHTVIYNAGCELPVDAAC